MLVDKDHSVVTCSHRHIQTVRGKSIGWLAGMSEPQASQEQSTGLSH